MNNYNYNLLETAGRNTAYNMNITKMVCPCCGKKMRLTDSSKEQFDDDLVTVSESVNLNENKLADRLLEIIEAVAEEIYQNELETNVPETDYQGNIIDSEYGDRFLYMDKRLKDIIKVKANAISNMVKHEGIDIAPYYIETQLFQILKAYGYKY